MYRKYFGLLRKPFELSPDADTFFFCKEHKEVLAGLRRGLAEDRNLLLLTGAKGTGKTTLLNVLVPSLKMRRNLCLIAEPVLGISDFFACLARQFGLQFNGNKAKFLVHFAQVLEKCRDTGRKMLLIIDEAHALPLDILEELRLLAHLATEVKSAFSILLAGQPELLCRLPQEQLFLLNQHVALRYHLAELAREECLPYILFRLNWAGARGAEFFPRQSAELIYDVTGGNPRQINALCDNIMLSAYSQGVQAIHEDLVRESIKLLPNCQQRRPAEHSGMRNWMVWTVLAILIAEGVGAAYAYQKGWFVPVCRYLIETIKLG